jgi:hypothetical protein
MRRDAWRFGRLGLRQHPDQISALGRDLAMVATNEPGMAASGIDPTAAWLLW